MRPRTNERLRNRHRCKPEWAVEVVEQPNKVVVEVAAVVEEEEKVVGRVDRCLLVISVSSLQTSKTRSSKPSYNSLVAILTLILTLQTSKTRSSKRPRLYNLAFRSSLPSCSACPELNASKEH